MIRETLSLGPQELKTAIALPSRIPSVFGDSDDDVVDDNCVWNVHRVRRILVVRGTPGI